MLQKPQHSHLLAVSFLLLAGLLHLKAQPISGTQGPWMLVYYHRVLLNMLLPWWWLCFQQWLTQASSHTPARLRARTSFEQGLIPSQGVNFLTPTTNSLFSNPLISVEVSKILTPVLQNLRKKPHNKKQNLFCSCWGGRGCFSWGQPLMCGGTGKQELSPAPELMVKKLMRRAPPGQDMFCHSWVVSTERFEAGVQSRRTQG